MTLLAALIPKFASSNPAEAVGFLKGDKNPQHAFLRKGSKIKNPMGTYPRYYLAAISAHSSSCGC
jgi:hypothetical protein